MNSIRAAIITFTIFYYCIQLLKKRVANWRFTANVQHEILLHRDRNETSIRVSVDMRGDRTTLEQKV